MAAPNAYDQAARDCVGVIHCASVTTFSPDPTEVITPSIAGALNALKAAAKETLVKRFVHCSSTAAAVSSDHGGRGVVSSDSWNMSSFLAAWQGPPYTIGRAWDVYCASKLQTEQAMWRWYQDNQPLFALNAGLSTT
jgi:nucleoside-diphosphate-sugar epimerase